MLTQAFPLVRVLVVLPVLYLVFAGRNEDAGPPGLPPTRGTPTG